MERITCNVQDRMLVFVVEMWDIHSGSCTRTAPGQPSLMHVSTRDWHNPPAHLGKRSYMYIYASCFWE